MYLTSEEKEQMAEEILELFLNETKGHEVFFAKRIGGLYETYDEFTADSVVRLFKNKLKQHYLNLKFKTKPEEK